MQKKQLLFILLMTFITISCNFNPIKQESVTIKLPAWNIQDFSLCKWKIEIQSSYYKDKFYISTNMNSFTISITKNAPLSITATPVIKLNDSNKFTYFFKPAGIIYPFSDDYDSNFIQMNWEEGFSAFIMQQLFKSTDKSNETLKFIHSFNWKRFNETIKTQIQESLNNEDNNFFNPWLIDYESIIDNLCSRKFSINLIKNKNCLCININELNLPITTQNLKIYSSFLPENDFIQQNNKLTISSIKINLFATEKNCLLIQYSNLKKISSQEVLMPILIDDI